MKKIKIGIPRALLFIEYLDFFIKFFENLNAEVIISSKSNKATLNNGVLVTVDDACLPIKLFHGHVIELIGKVDYIFIPRIMSIYKDENICPKFGGLPELIKYSIKDLPPIITTEINNYKSNNNFLSTINEIGSYFTDDKDEIQKAYLIAYKQFTDNKNKVKMATILNNDSIKLRKKNSTTLNNKLRVLTVGHSYNLYDSFSNMNLFNKLLKYNLDYMTPENFDLVTIKNYSNKYKGRQYWTFSKKIIGSVLYCIENKTIDGIIFLTSFGCGIDSVVINIVERIARKQEIPMIILSIDEHTGEAGFNTRIEAFIDMLERRSDYDSNVPTYGKYLYSNKSSIRRIRH